MELYKTEYSNSRGKGKLDKILINCKDTSYYKLTEFLYKSQNDQAIIINALYDNNVDIVLKFGILNYIEKEYEISKELNDLPNFIRYLCMIKCNDEIKNIINHKQQISNYVMCHYGSELVGIFVMKYYNLGCINDYNWTKDNFNILKNVIKQVIFAIIYAYETKGFLHGDLHCGNVLLKRKNDNIIKYGNKELEINTLEVVIMNFEKSRMNEKEKIVELIKNIYKFISSIVTSNDMKLNIDYDINKLISLKSILNDNKNYYDEIEQIINNMYLYE